MFSMEGRGFKGHVCKFVPNAAEEQMCGGFVFCGGLMMRSE